MKNEGVGFARNSLYFVVVVSCRATIKQHLLFFGCVLLRGHVLCFIISCYFSNSAFCFLVVLLTFAVIG